MVPKSLFAESEENHLRSAQPLAARMRPQSLEEFAGQEHFLGEGKLLTRLIQADRLGSVLFYGPPGTGKTTLARLLAGACRSVFQQVSAVTSGVKELRAVSILEEGFIRRVRGVAYSARVSPQVGNRVVASAR